MGQSVRFKKVIFGIRREITINILSSQATYRWAVASYYRNQHNGKMLYFRSQIRREQYEWLTPDETSVAGSDQIRWMPRKILLLLSLSVAWILLTGCECDCDDVEKVPPVCFEYHYINHAWGYQEQGWLMDWHGNIWSYDKPDDYIHGEIGAYLTLEDMEHNLALTDSLIGNVEPSELARYLALIPGASQGQIGDSVNIAADAGASSLSCYLYDHEQGAYRYVFLGMSGDWEQLNLSAEADSLIKWLREFDVFWLSD